MAGYGNTIPKPEGQRRRRNAVPGTIHLPAAGRQGDVPEWPLGRPTKRELVLWGRLWKTPQAVAWEQLGWIDVVARYARVEAIAERRDAPITSLSEVRQLEDRLGLSPMAMLRLRWVIADAEEVDQEVDAGMVDIRQRLRAVE